MKICTLVLLGLIVVSLTSAIKLDLGVRQTNTLTSSLGRLRKPTEARDMLHSQKRANWRIPLIGNLTYWGEYFASVGIGSPAQYVNLQVDTGSTDLIVYSKDCSGCNASASFDQGASSTAQTFYCDADQFTCYTPNNDCDGTDLCAWEDQFGDGSTIDGYVIQDLLTIGSQPQMQNPVSLGTIQSVDAPNGFEAFGVDGIWGLAFQDLSGWGGDPAISLIFDEYNMYRSFDLCLGDNGGTLAIGDDYSSDSRFVWTDITQDQWYTIYMTDWRIGGVSLNISESYLNWNGVIVDSGTTLLIVPYWVMNPIKAYLTQLSKTTNLVGITGVPPGKTLFDGQCFTMTPQQVSAYPTMSFGFDGVKPLLGISPSDYLWQGTGVPGQYCLGIQDIDDTLPVILGDVFMQNYHVVFDRAADKVGFGPLSSCPK